MDTENERDTHFKQFASLLWQELLLSENFSYNIVFTREEAKAIKMIIARRAYDLMEHILLYAPAAPVPDLTEWPEQ